MQPIQIVAIMLVRNEDVYIERVIRNILDFCDGIIITDHQSSDGTFKICKRLADEFPKISLQSIQSPRESALAIEAYAGTNTWIFGVDGDEIYDPQGLKIMREHLLNGLFSKDWCIFGNALNVVSFNFDNNTAKGYLAPPCRPTSKLYNFSFIEWWINSSERLHGEDIKFKPGCDGGLRRYLHTETSWDQSYFRHLHMPFMKRSTQQKAGFIKTRLNPDELMRADLEKYKLARLLMLLRIQVAQVFGFDWKNKKYRRGPLVEKDITQFFH